MIEKLSLSPLAAAAALMIGATPAVLAGPGDLANADEIDSCLAAVNRHIDLTDAKRVRHVVRESDRTGIGYALTIETSVFANESERRYAAYCVASGSSDPVKFRIDEQES